MYWTFHRNGPPECSVITSIDDKIYCFENSFKCDNNEPMRVHVFDTVNYSYITVEPKPDDMQYTKSPGKCHSHSAVPYESKVYVWGGESVNGISEKSVFCFDSKTLQWTKPTVHGDVPEPRMRHSACIVGHCMYIYGGVKCYSYYVSDEMYVLDLVAMRWQRLETQGLPACPLSSVCVQNDRIFMVCTCVAFTTRKEGSRLCSVSLKERAAYFDTCKATWTATPASRSSHCPAPIFLASPTIFTRGENIYLFGGRENGGQMFRFSPKTLEWMQLKQKGYPPRPENSLVGTLVGNRMFFMGSTGVHILEFFPSLQTRCLTTVLQYQLDVRKYLPECLKRDYDDMNKIQIFS